MNLNALLASFWFGVAWGAITGGRWTDDGDVSYFLVAVVLALVLTTMAIVQRRRGSGGRDCHPH